ncbi:MAG: DUF4349 domain-containing protein [Gemmatimonadaceae bacterium]|nr:DUF4349 domain-containing protein [Gemmatimonadaceae bacterium]
MKVVFLAGFCLLIAACDSPSPDVSQSAGGFTGAAEQPASAPPMVGKEKRQSLTATAAVAEGTAQDAAATPQPGPAATRPAGAAEIAPSMLIRTGNASLEVPQLDPAIIKVRQLATQLGGYVANSSISGGRDQIRSATLELKIPAARYDQAVTGLGGIGKVEAVNTSVEDVGEEYVDLTARVTNARRLEERLVGLLATRTGKLEDVLAVERELARVREEIERFEGRMRFLRTRAAVSTLSVTVHEPAPLLGQTPGENPIASALTQAWRNFVGFIAALIASLGILIPLAALGVVGWLVFRRVRRNRG